MAERDAPPASPLPGSLGAFGGWLARRQRRLLVLFVALLAIGALPSLALRVVPVAGVRDPLPLQSVRGARAMIDVLACQNGSWPSQVQAVPPGKAASAAEVAASAPPPPPPAATGSCDAASVPHDGPAVRLLPIRWVLALDSLGTVPGYAGLFMLALSFLFVRGWAADDRACLRPGIDWRELVLQLACVVPAAAAAFDLAENGVTIIAIEDAVSGVLADDTVGDMHLATACKWGLFALSCALTAAIAVVGELRRLADGLWGRDTPRELPAALARAVLVAAGSRLGLVHGVRRIEVWDALPPALRSALSEVDGVLLASAAAGTIAWAALVPAGDALAPASTAAGIGAFILQMALVGWRIWRAAPPSPPGQP
ncbi:MAG: hypothetical protein ACTHL8_21060 [Burkholderiaceae bacterium]